MNGRQGLNVFASREIASSQQFPSSLCYATVAQDHQLVLLPGESLACTIGASQFFNGYFAAVTLAFCAMHTTQT